MAAVNNVRKLAPELRVTSNSFGNLILELGRHYFTDRGCQKLDDSYKCCSETFDSEDEIPKIEKALTIYLWWKLFPERFNTRQYLPLKSSRWECLWGFSGCMIMIICAYSYCLFPHVSYWYISFVWCLVLAAACFFIGYVDLKGSKRD